MIKKNIHFKNFTSAGIKDPDHKRNRGIAILWVAISLLVLLLFMGLAIDGGRIYFAAHQLQNAADAAALAGARIVRIDQDLTRAEAQKFAGLNYCLGNAVLADLNTDNVPEGDIVIGKFYLDTRTFVPIQDLAPDVKPDSVKVVTKRTETEHGGIPLFFAPLIGINSANVSRVAIAQALGGWGAGIIALDCDEPKALDISDAAIDLTLVAGGIQVNSSADNAFYTNSNTVFNPVPEIINVNGGVVWNKFPESLAEVTNLGAPPMPDPLCPDGQCDGTVAGGDCIGVPSFGPEIQPETVTVDPNEIKTISPGYYPGGIRLTNATGTLNLEPGIYVLDGEGLYINGGNISAPEGVMFYITGNGTVNMRGNGSVEINTVSEIESGPFTGIAIYQDRNNLNDAYISGGSNLNIVGTVYFPQNHVSVGGTGDGFGTQLIANTIEIFGTGTVQINYDGRNPFPANKSLLVW